MQPIEWLLYRMCMEPWTGQQEINMPVTDIRGNRGVTYLLSGNTVTDHRSQSTCMRMPTWILSGSLPVEDEQRHSCHGTVPLPPHPWLAATVPVEVCYYGQKHNEVVVGSHV